MKIGKKTVFIKNGRTYPQDLDEYEIEADKINIPEGQLLVSYWNGDYADILVDEKITLELKCVETITNVHLAQTY